MRRRGQGDGVGAWSSARSRSRTGSKGGGESEWGCGWLVRASGEWIRGVGGVRDRVGRPGGPVGCGLVGQSPIGRGVFFSFFLCFFSVLF